MDLLDSGGCGHFVGVSVRLQRSAFASHKNLSDRSIPHVSESFAARHVPLRLSTLNCVLPESLDEPISRSRYRCVSLSQRQAFIVSHATTRAHGRSRWSRWLTRSVFQAPAWLGVTLVKASPILLETPVNYSQDSSLIIVCPAGYS